MVSYRRWGGGIQYRWSGQVMEPQDSMAFIGHNPGDKSNNFYIVTGDSGNGITHGTVAGILLTDLIIGKKRIHGLLSMIRQDSQKSQEEMIQHRKKKEQEHGVQRKKKKVRLIKNSKNKKMIKKQQP